jgi:hypothetical protein
MKHRVRCWAIVLAGLAASCTDGVANPLVPAPANLSTAGVSAGSAGATAAGTGGSAGKADDRDPLAGRGNPFSCPASSDEEIKLLATLNDAIARDDYCFAKTLTENDDLRCFARSWANAARSSDMSGSGPHRPQAPVMFAGWFPDSDGDSLWWVRNGIEHLEDAQTRLLTEDRKIPCESAQRATYNSAGVAHEGDAWVVVVATE